MVTFLSIVAIALALFASFTVKKLVDTSAQCKKNSALAEQRLSDLHVQANDFKLLSKKADNYHSCLIHGCENVSIQKRPGAILVVGSLLTMDMRSDCIIKRFEVELDSYEDAEYKLRCAEELVEKLKETV